MVTTMKQAIRIQSQRVLSRKRGYARAVIRYLLREHGQDPEYQEWKSELPARSTPSLESRSRQGKKRAQRTCPPPRHK